MKGVLKEKNPKSFCFLILKKLTTLSFYMLRCPFSCIFSLRQRERVFVCFSWRLHDRETAHPNDRVGVRGWVSPFLGSENSLSYTSAKPCEYEIVDKEK